MKKTLISALVALCAASTLSDAAMPFEIKQQNETVFVIEGRLVATANEAYQQVRYRVGPQHIATMAYQEDQRDWSKTGNYVLDYFTNKYVQVTADCEPLGEGVRVKEILKINLK